MLISFLNPKTVLSIKKYGYLMFLVPLLLPVTSYFLGMKVGLHGLAPWLVVLSSFVVLPVADLVMGKDPVNAKANEESLLNDDKFYQYLAISGFPLYFICLFSTGYFLINWTHLTSIGQLGYAVSMGVVGGIIAINMGHELIHKSTKLERVSGGLLLSLVSYGGFKIEHIYGHHVNVSTPMDASSSRYNQSLYAFLKHAYVHNFLNAWTLQKKRLIKKGVSFFSVKNELIWYYGFSVVICFLMGLFFKFLGADFWMGITFFFIQSFIAFTILEVINYIEHYGLHRRQLDNGKYERVTPEHSWNSNFFLTNMFLFQLQRHSDHHTYAARRYQVLRHNENSPQLPFGYPTMFVIALIPPLWKALMNPRVEAYYKDDETALTAH
ncbi:MAG: alkane 1-monooxygenase [Bermanella sp.]|jgi:alkane 1-monooxygenase